MPSVVPCPKAKPLTLNFHPDTNTDGEFTIERIAREGFYKSQFETKTSNGGLTAQAKGERWEWESRIFGGAYDDADPALRPKYGALNFTHCVIGGSPRFGSCHFRLLPHVLARTTFCYPDSHLKPETFGVADHMSLIDLAERNSLGLDPALDNYVEAHVHGPLSIERTSKLWCLILAIAKRQSKRLQCGFNAMLNGMTASICD